MTAMSSDPYDIVTCPQCGTQQWLPPDRTQYSCDKCGRNWVVARACGAERNDSQWDDIQHILSEIMKQLEGRKPITPEQEKTLDNLIVQLKETNKLIAQSSSNFSPAKIVPVSQQYVPRDMADAVNEADLEAGVALSIFTLFLGIFIQEWVNRGQWSATVVALFLPTLVAGAVTGYFYYKRYKRKQELNEAIKVRSVSISAVWIGQPSATSAAK